MKYLLLFVLPVLLLCSCEKDPIETIKGDYTLVSYTKVDCEHTDTDLAWRDVDNTVEELSVSGTLDIKLFSIFKQKLIFSEEGSTDLVEKKFVGAFTQSGEGWIAEYSGSPFSGSHCEEAEVTVVGSTLTWSFTEDECRVILVWEKV